MDNEKNTGGAERCGEKKGRTEIEKVKLFIVESFGIIMLYLKNIN
ncbi:hypothetical protein OFR43_14690 [Brachyspira hyodysenteriae]|nr:hypothetical protein [Brachyspira hyodysenteriae]MDA0039048.1 hypothetical protein [Brachyspira hyodysenteriae]